MNNFYKFLKDTEIKMDELLEARIGNRVLRVKKVTVKSTHGRKSYMATRHVASEDVELPNKPKVIEKPKNDNLHKKGLKLDDNLKKMVDSNPDVQEFMPIAKQIKKAGGRAFIVGGFVRDLVRGKPPKDVDVEVYGLELDYVENILKNFGEPKLVGKSFGVLKMGNFDVSLPRTERKVGIGHKGFNINIDHSLSIEDASRRRDLRFNSMLYDPMEHELFDPHKGMEDIKAGIIRHTDDHAFAEDPLRVFRVARFAARMGFKIHHGTTQLSKKLLNELGTLPKERLFGEFEKILMKSKRPSTAFRWLDEVGVTEQMFPELHALKAIEQGKKHHPEDNAFEHTMLALDAIPRAERTLPVMLAVLTHDMGKAHVPISTEEDGDVVHFFGHAEEGVAPAERFLRRITEEKDVIEPVLKLVQHHMRPYDLKRKADKASVRRLSLKVDIPELLKLHYADKKGRGKEVPDSDLEYIAKIMDVYDSIKNETKPLIKGQHLINDFGMKPGVHFGAILKDVFDAQLSGDFSDEAGGLNFVKNYLARRKNEV